MLNNQLAEAEDRFRKGQYVETLQILNRLSSLSEDPRSINLLGETLIHLGMYAEAASAFELHADREGAWQQAFLKKAALLFFLTGEKEKAKLYAFRVLTSEPKSPEAAFVLVNLLKSPQDKAMVEGLTYNLIESDVPDHLELAYSRLGAEVSNERLLPLMRKLAPLKPEDSWLQRLLLAFAREYADYDVLDKIEAELAAGTRAPIRELPLEALFGHASESDPAVRVIPELSTPFDPEKRAARRTAPRSWGPKLRIGYISSDFMPEHVVMRQLADVLRRHDRDKFSITLFCNSPWKGGDRKRFFAELGHHVDISDLPDKKAGKEVRRRDIDILVDLGGHTSKSRAALLNLGLAPIQVSWLGYPGPALGLDCDYVISDRIVTPETSAQWYDEKFCWMPETYMPNDPTVRKVPSEVSRADHGLPENAFVFASFNAPKKITPRVIALWARILKAVPESVLWMTCRAETAEKNIAKRFAALGVDTTRIIFAEAIRSYDDHVGRLRAADLGLDPFPYNGHATTADCLWAGLPVLSLKGQSFAARVSESQLNAVGLDNLVAADEEDYVERAVALAKDAAAVKAYRDHLDQNRFRAPLFDSERYCRHLESAYRMMAERARAGLPPEHLSVPLLPPATADFAHTAKA